MRCSNINNINKDKIGVFIKWINYRKEIKKEIKNPSTIELLIKKFNSLDIKHVELTVDASISNGWTGLFFDKYKPEAKNGPGTNETFDASNY